MIEESRTVYEEHRTKKRVSTRSPVRKERQDRQRESEKRGKSVTASYDPLDIQAILDHNSKLLAQIRQDMTIHYQKRDDSERNSHSCNKSSATANQKSSNLNEIGTRSLYEGLDQSKRNFSNEEIHDKVKRQLEENMLIQSNSYKGQTSNEKDSYAYSYNYNQTQTVKSSYKNSTQIKKDRWNHLESNNLGQAYSSVVNNSTDYLVNKSQSSICDTSKFGNTDDDEFFRHHEVYNIGNQQTQEYQKQEPKSEIPEIQQPIGKFFKFYQIRSKSSQGHRCTTP